MISRIHSAILQGIDAVGCEVEADTVSSVGRARAALRDGGHRRPDFRELRPTGPKVGIPPHAA